MPDQQFSVVVFGSINHDLTMVVRDFPKSGETLMSLESRHGRGGKGGNQAIAAARMRARVAIVGAVGDDSFGHDLRDYLATSGIDVSHVGEIADVPTGLAHILVNEVGENVIVVAPGANHRISIEAMRTNLPAAHIYLAQLECNPDIVAAFFERGRKLGGMCILNAAPAIAEGGDLFPLCDIILMNEPELAVYAKLPLADDRLEAIEAAAARLITRPEQTVIVTRGKRGVIAVRSGATLVAPACEVVAVDTTGAGDCFCGALAAELSRGSAMAHAIEYANAAAAITVGRIGAAQAMPTLAEVTAAIASGKSRAKIER